MADEKSELNAEQLGQTGGGADRILNYSEADVLNSKNEIIGHVYNGGKKIKYVPCDKCRRPMHNGAFGWYCDPCDRHLCFVNWYDWNGTVDELKAAAP